MIVRFGSPIMDRTTIRTRVCSILSQFVDGIPDLDSKIDKMNIISDQMLDSFSVVSVIAIIEEEFDIEFTPDDLSSERLRTFGGMFDLIQKKNEKV